MKPIVPWVACVVGALLFLEFGRDAAWKIALALTILVALSSLGIGGSVGWHTASDRARERANVRQFSLPSVVCLVILYAIHFKH